MSKAVLVIDMPKRCKDCFRYRADPWFGGSCTQAKEKNGWNKNIGADEEYDVQNWCPLRPLPEKWREEKRLIDADRLMLSLADWKLQEAPIHTYEKPKEFTADDMQRMIWRTIRDCESAVEEQPTVNAIPIEVFYKMIHNALADTKKENWEPEECPYDYFDGNRNAIHCMLDILCGDKDGDHDDFWKEYMDWEKENENN